MRVTQAPTVLDETRGPTPPPTSPPSQNIACLNDPDAIGCENQDTVLDDDEDDYLGTGNIDFDDDGNLINTDGGDNSLVTIPVKGGLLPDLEQLQEVFTEDNLENGGSVFGFVILGMLGAGLLAAGIKAARKVDGKRRNKTKPNKAASQMSSNSLTINF